MKNWKSTLAGAALAVIIAIQPLLDGAGYHLDKPTIIRLIFAAGVAYLGYITKDKDVTGV